MNVPEEKLEGIAFVIGGLSFIPLVGVPFGIAAIVWGISTKKSGGKKLALIGSLGILVTGALYGGLFYFGFVKRGGIYDDLRAQLAQSTLNSVVQAVEFYRVQHGSYPESLKVLQESLPKDSTVFVFDPSDVRFGGTPRYFYYERVGADHYYLRGVGRDGVPFTADDILPQVQLTPGSKVGLLVERMPQLEAADLGGYSRDWSVVVQQISVAGNCNRKVEIGKSAGLKTVPEGGTDFRNHESVVFLDPVTHKPVYQFSCEMIPMRLKASKP